MIRVAVNAGGLEVLKQNDIVFRPYGITSSPSFDDAVKGSDTTKYITDIQKSTIAEMGALGVQIYWADDSLR